MTVTHAPSAPNLTNQDLADRYGVSINTINKWRARGTGPRAIKVGKHVRYRLEDVLDWEERNADPIAV